VSRLHCLFDTSAFIKHYNNKEEHANLVEEIFRHKRTITICFPNVCILEFRKNIHKAVTTEESNRISPAVRNKILKAFTYDIETYRIAIHNVTHRNIKMTAEIFKCAYDKRIGAAGLSGIDAVVVSSAYQINRYATNFRLVTNDEDIKKVASHYNIKVWYLRELKLSEIRKAIKEK